MRNLKLALLLPALLLAWLAPVFAAPAAVDIKRPAYDLLADLGPVPAGEIVLSAPAAPAADPFKYVKPPCVPSQALLPGRSFFPVVSDARRVRAIDDLLARIAACKPMSYDNDGNVHSKPHEGLPAKPAGYYKEYTLLIPGRPAGSGSEAVVIGGQTYMTGPVMSVRGPERLMIGGSREVYYTPDHYNTFVLLSIVR